MPDLLPTSMPAAVYQGKGAITVETVPVPTPGPGQVLVEISHCGICGSDLHMVLEGWGQPGHIGGHESSGRVVAVGEGVTRWEPGDAVVTGPSPKCGECDPCRAGRPSLCMKRTGPTEDHGWQGAFATYVCRDEGELYRIPPNLALRHAALTEPLAVALHGITLSGARPGERVLVTGAGPHRPAQHRRPACPRHRRRHRERAVAAAPPARARRRRHQRGHTRRARDAATSRRPSSTCPTTRCSSARVTRARWSRGSATWCRWDGSCSSARACDGRGSTTTASC